MTIKIDAIRIDGGTQPRVKIDQATIARYIEDIENDANFPPVVIFFDGVDNWLAEGFHRYHAHANAGKKVIAAEIRNGTQRDAILYSVGANSEHGLPRSSDDKRSAISKLLQDEEWGAWSDREIARQCHVGHELVSKVRKVYLDDRPDATAGAKKRKAKRGGKEYEQKSDKEGSAAVPQTPESPTPAAPPPPAKSAKGTAAAAAQQPAPDERDERIAELEEQLQDAIDLAERAQAEVARLSELVDADSEPAKIVADLQKRLGRCQATLRTTEMDRDNAKIESNVRLKDIKRLQRDLNKLEAEHAKCKK